MTDSIEAERKNSVRWTGTLLYPAVLVAIFLGIQLLEKVLEMPAQHRATFAAIPALLALLISLPWRVHQTWGTSQAWQALGLKGNQRDSLHALINGLIKAVLLLGLALIGLTLAKGLSWEPRLSPLLLLNGLALALGVGFAEELLFRGWLFGELTLLIGKQRALWLQAGIFSLVHLQFSLPLLSLIGLLGGLLMLGLALGLQRLSDGGLLWGAIGLHGGLVGGWFLLSQGLVEVHASAPEWLTGPATNPIGGLLGWLGLALLIWFRRRWW